MAEIVERQAARIERLEGQVEMLKKLEATERRLLSDSQKLRTQKIFQLISKTIQQLPFKRMVTYFCQFLHVCPLWILQLFSDNRGTCSERTEG